MIIKLNHKSKVDADQIYKVFQASYQIEADLIGVEDFPPLMRKVERILTSKSEFYGCDFSGLLAAVIEIECADKELEINSLTVHPDFFRQGLARKLIDCAFNVAMDRELKVISVETAFRNKPAIRLYEKHGFEQVKRWIPDHGIEKVAFSRTIL